MTTTKFFGTQDAALNEAKNMGETSPVLVIDTHGYGFEIVPNSFQTDRMYYHGEGGKKMFFTPIAYVHPAGVIRYLSR